MVGSTFAKKKAILTMIAMPEIRRGDVIVITSKASPSGFRSGQRLVITSVEGQTKLYISRHWWVGAFWLFVRECERKWARVKYWGRVIDNPQHPFWKRDE
jgi:hypothetical protein